MRWAAVLFLLTPLANAQSDLCSIEGQVINAATGEPVRKASLMLRPAETNRVGPRRGYSAVTDASGRFAMKEIDPGRYTLTAQRDGFGRAEYGARRTGAPGAIISLSAGQQVKDVNVRLTPNGAVAGRVVDEDGEPVVYVLVSLLRYKYLDGRRQLAMEGGETTNDLGEYRVFNLPPGKYYVSASDRRTMRSSQGLAVRSSGPGPEENYVITYYPGTTGVADATVLDVRPGAQLRGIDFALLKARTVRVRGHVTVPPETGQKNINIMFHPRGWAAAFGTGRTAHADSQGAFEFSGIAPGPYTLAAVLSDGEQRLTTRQQVDVGSTNVDDLNVVIAPGMEVSGQVRAEGTNAPDLARVRVLLRARDAASGTFGPMVSGEIRENGVFALPGVSPNIYTFQLFDLPDGYWVKSVRFGDQDGLENGLDLTRGAAGKVSVMIAPNAGQVEGTVLDAKHQPVAGATVVLVPESRRREELYRSYASGESGRFTLRNITPGEYKLFAWDGVDSDAWLDPDFLKPVESQGRAVSIREGGRESVELKVIEGEQ